MDVKSKVNFINSVATGDVIPCPKCGANNAQDRKVCSTCGAALRFEDLTSTFQKVKIDDLENSEPNAVFAQGLPEWNIEPPHIMVRRR